MPFRSSQPIHFYREGQLLYTLAPVTADAERYLVWPGEGEVSFLVLNERVGDFALPDGGGKYTAYENGRPMFRFIATKRQQEFIEASRGDRGNFYAFAILPGQRIVGGSHRGG